MTFFSAIQSTAVNQAFYQHLLGLQSADAILLPLSDGAINPYMARGDYDHYVSALEPYETGATRPGRYEALQGQRHMGHKIHLNVGPQFVGQVSEYLRDEGFHHKFLRGGAVEDGKMFTVYFGAKDLADYWAPHISEQLRIYLARPSNNLSDEVEYAPNIIGRFVGGRDRFHQYGMVIRGLSILDRVIRRPRRSRLWRRARDSSDGPILDLSRWNRMTRQDQEEARFRAFVASYAFAAQHYGAFFYGSGVSALRLNP